MKLEIKKNEKNKMLTFIKEIEPIIRNWTKYRQVLCRCDCWNETELSLYSFKSQNKTKSCWCEAKRVATKHWMLWTRFYWIWQAMRNRMKAVWEYNKEHYSHLTHEDRWNDFKQFKDDFYESYLAHSKNHWEDNTSLDRVDNSRWYYLDNIRWATRWVQQRNTSKTINHTINWKTLCLKDWCKELWLDYKNIHYKYKYRWVELKELLKIDGN